MKQRDGKERGTFFHLVQTNHSLRQKITDLFHRYSLRVIIVQILKIKNYLHLINGTFLMEVQKTTDSRKYFKYLFFRGM